MTAAFRAEPPVRTFCTVLHDTGCRISEALALTPAHVDLNGRAVIFESLKKRRKGVHRAVPVPPGLLDTLDMVHGLRKAQRRGKGHVERPLWPWARNTAWRQVKAVMLAADIPDGPHRTPQRAASRLRGARHRCRRAAQHAQQVDGARHARGDGDLRQCVGGRRSRASPRGCGDERRGLRCPGMLRYRSSVSCARSASALALIRNHDRQPVHQERPRSGGAASCGSERSAIIAPCKGSCWPSSRRLSRRSVQRRQPTFSPRSAGSDCTPRARAAALIRADRDGR